MAAADRPVYARLSSSRWVRRDAGVLSGGHPNWVHVTGPDDTSPAHATYPTGYDHRCGWCWLGAQHSDDEHRRDVEGPI